MYVNWLKSALLVIAVCVAGAMPCELMAQVPVTEQEARAYLEGTGINEEQFRARMQEKGYDPDDLEPARLQTLTVAEVTELQRVAEETIAELQAENMAARRDTIPVDTIRVPPVTGEKKDQEPEKEEEEEPEPEDMEEAEVAIYGHQLFRSTDVKVYEATDGIKPSPTYVLGVGDELTIFINGASVVNESVTIDARGNIKLDRSVPIPVRGLTVASAEALLRTRLKRHYSYRDDQFNMSVSSARTITVNIYGEAIRPGAYTISAVNPLFNALVASGGPSDIGSVRHIRLIRGSSEKTFDLYAFMQDPRVAEEFYLQENDYIHVRTAERVVEIKGAVRRPHRYELKEDEHLLKLIEYAGGTENDAYLRDVQITRYTNDRRVVINVDLREIMNSSADFLLSSGDIVRIKSVEERIKNFVQLKGAVVNSGRFERKESMRLTDLLALGQLDEQARLDFAYILRFDPTGTYRYVRINPEAAINDPASAQNILLQDKDIVHIQSLDLYSDDIKFTVSGAVRAPGTYDFDPAGSMTIQDAILISGGLRQSASEFGYVARHFENEPNRTEYLPFSVSQVVNDPASSDNLLLARNDSLVIFDKNSLTDEFWVTVKGAVRLPGRFRYDPDMTLAEALRLAGGLTFSAASNRVDIARVIILENQPTRTANYTASVDRDLNINTGDSTFRLFPFDQVVVREVPEFELQRYVYLRGEVRYPGSYPIIGENERVASFIERAGGLSPEAFLRGARLVRSAEDVGVVIIDLETALRNRRSTSNLVLQDGDTITVPKVQELVSITGAVNLRELYSNEFIEAGNKINVTFEQGKNANYYINKYAAGIAEQGRRRLITVVHANGRVEKTQNLGLIRIYPKVSKGSTINVGTVPEKETREKEARQEVDWSQIVQESLAQATAILTLILLIERL